MTRDEAIEQLKWYFEYDNGLSADKETVEAYKMAIKALENIGHITDRPCDVCEFHGENGCTQWKCVFCDELFGEMR